MHPPSPLEPRPPRWAAVDSTIGEHPAAGSGHIGANFNIDSAARHSYLALFNVSKILPFIRSAISAAGSGFWHSDSGLSQKLELGNISNRLRAAAPRQVSGSFT